jgi:hypothetical protein
LFIGNQTIFLAYCKGTVFAIYGSPTGQLFCLANHHSKVNFYLTNSSPADTDLTYSFSLSSFNGDSLK